MKKIGIGLVIMIVFLFANQQSSLASHITKPDEWVYVATLNDEERYFIKEDVLYIAKKIYQATDNPLERNYMVIARHTLKAGGYVVQLFQYDFPNKKQRLLGSIQYNVFGEEIINTLDETHKVPWEDIKENTPDDLIFSVAKEYVIENKDIRALYELNIEQELETE